MNRYNHQPNDTVQGKRNKANDASIVPRPDIPAGGPAPEARYCRFSLSASAGGHKDTEHADVQRNRMRKEKREHRPIPGKITLVIVVNISPVEESDEQAAKSEHKVLNGK